MKERPILFSGSMVRAILDGRKTQTRRIVKPQPFKCAIMPNPIFPLNQRELADQSGLIWPNSKDEILARCPYGKIGDRLWVRESWHIEARRESETQLNYTVAYKPCSQIAIANGWSQDSRDFDLPVGTPIPSPNVPTFGKNGIRWRPSIHMPRWASRITLEITGIRVERLQNISEEDAKAEGIERIIDNSGFNGPDCWRDYQDASGIPFDGDKPVASFKSLWESINGAESWAANPWVWAIEFKRITP